MSLDLSVLMSEIMTKDLFISVNDFLMENGFYKDEYGYRSGSKGISIDVYIIQKLEEDDCWEDGEAAVIGFSPKAEIDMESMHSEESHRENYRLAKELAKFVEGIIYDHQVAVFYDAEGWPCGHFREDEKLEDYGAGLEPFMDAVGRVKEVLNGK